MAGTFSNELRNVIRNAWCNALNTGYNFLDALPDPIVNSGDVPIARANRALYRMFCNREPPPPIPPPFTGGQCAGVQYDVQCNYSFTAGGGAVINTYVQGTVYGAVYPGGVTITQTASSTWAMKYYCGQPPGTPYLNLGTTGALATANEIKSSATLQVLRRHDYAPDTCGDPPPVILPPTPGYNHPTINFTYTNNSSVDVSISANLTFAPSVLNNYGDVTVPIRVSLLSDNTIIGGTINLNTGDINLNFGNRNYSPSDRGTPDTYDSPTDTPNIPPDVPVPVTPPSPDSTSTDTTRLLRACIVTVTNLSQSASTIIYQDDNPDIFVPNLGYVQFLIAIGNKLAWTEDIPVKNKRHFITCPWEGGALQVRGTPRAGVTWAISPVYTKQENVVVFD